MSPRSTAFSNLLTTLLLLLSSTFICVSAQTTTTSQLSIYPGNTNFAYYGCYNETNLLNNTNGQRALNGGIVEALDSMTVEMCLGYCSSNKYTFAGLEYTRECYCASYLSSLSVHLADDTCNLPCKGNASQVCGGSWSLTVYQLKSASTTSAKGAAAGRKEVGRVGSILALGVALGVLFVIA